MPLELQFIFRRAAALSSAVFLRSLRIAICPSLCRTVRASRRTCFASRALAVCRFSRTLRAIVSPRACLWIWTIVLSTCCACKICLHTVARSVSPCFTALRCLACWRSVGNVRRLRLPMTSTCSRSFATTCPSSWSAWHRACVRVVRQSLVVPSMCCVMSCLPF